MASIPRIPTLNKHVLTLNDEQFIAHDGRVLKLHPQQVTPEVTHGIVQVDDKPHVVIPKPPTEMTIQDGQDVEDLTMHMFDLLLERTKDEIGKTMNEFVKSMKDEIEALQTQIAERLGNVTTASIVDTKSSDDIVELAPASPEEKKEIPSALEQCALCTCTEKGDEIVSGQEYYCIPNAWLRTWLSIVRRQGQSWLAPDVIDTTPLVDKMEGDMIWIKLMSDFKFIRADNWRRLVSWYGHKGPEIRRIASNNTGGNAFVGLNPLTLPLTLLYYPHTSTTATRATSAPSQSRLESRQSIHIFNSQTLGALKAQIASNLGIDDIASFRLWDFYCPSRLTLLLDENKTLGSLRIVTENAILVECAHPITNEFLFCGYASLGQNLCLDSRS